MKESCCWTTVSNGGADQQRRGQVEELVEE